jgi:hypothetical protein
MQAAKPSENTKDWENLKSDIDQHEIKMKNVMDLYYKLSTFNFEGKGLKTASEEGQRL